MAFVGWYFLSLHALVSVGVAVNRASCKRWREAVVMALFWPLALGGVLSAWLHHKGL